jgi:chloramphenicol 3-O-phosphotransferase
MLSSTARFADDAAGLEKALRLIQGLCTFMVGVTTSTERAAPWRQARSQIALGKFSWA